MMHLTADSRLLRRAERLTPLPYLKDPTRVLPPREREPDEVEEVQVIAAVADTPPAAPPNPPETPPVALIEDPLSDFAQGIFP